MTSLFLFVLCVSRHDVDWYQNNLYIKNGLFSISFDGYTSEDIGIVCYIAHKVPSPPLDSDAFCRLTETRKALITPIGTTETPSRSCGSASARYKLSPWNVGMVCADRNLSRAPREILRMSLNAL